jgi:hypothetical protein
LKEAKTKLEEAITKLEALKEEQSKISSSIIQLDGKIIGIKREIE